MTRERVRPERQGARLPDGGPPDVTRVDGTVDEGPVPADAAVRRIRDRATDVRDAELETALGKLEARGGLSETDREVVEKLADRLVEGLLAVPVSALREADATAERAANEDDTVEPALELFG